MLKYNFKKEDIEKVCNKYEINENEFEGMRDKIGMFYTGVRIQHLSSIMRNLEIKGRYLTKRNDFRIDWGEIDGGAAHSMWKNGRFVISLPENIGDEQARYIVAHELGHLFCVLEMMEEMKLSNEDERLNLNAKLSSKAENAMMHRKANAFGVSVIQERSEFYKTKVLAEDGIIRKTIGKSVEEVMAYFN